MGDTKPSIQVNITIDGVTTHKKVRMDSFNLGRHADSDVNVLHPQVSRQHLKITVQDNKIFCEDVGSSNGTFKEKQRIQPNQTFLLEPTDSLQLGEDGPIIQVQFCEEKHTALSKLSKLESLIAPIMPHSKPQSNIDPAALPKVVQIAPAGAQSSSQGKPAPLTIPEPPKSPAKTVVDNPLLQPLSVQPRESNQPAVIEANKQAVQILQKAEMQAEAKIQQAHKQALEIEERAERNYKARLKDANDDAEKLFADAKEETLKLLQEARAQTQVMREQAEKDMRDLRKATEEKCVDVLKEAETQGQTIKNKRLSEADEIIEKKGQELLKATHEKIKEEKEAAAKSLETLKTQTAKAVEEKKKADEELIASEKKLAQSRKDLKASEEEAESRKANFDKIKSDEKSMLSHIELMKKELAEQEKSLEKLKADSEKYTLSISSMKNEKEDKEKEMNAQLQALKAKLEEEKAILTQREADRTNQLKLETAEAIKKFERELIEEIISRKTQITKEIMLQVVALCPTVALNEEWKSKNSDLNHIIQEIIGNSDQASAQKVVDNKAKGGMSTRAKEKTMSLVLGLFLGIFVLAAGQKITDHYGDSPIDRMVASAIDSTKAELEKRKFDPPQVTEVKDNYVDSVIYTRNFTQTYLDPKYQEAWAKAATLYLLKTWRLDEDKSTKALAASAALVKDLHERRENIHPDFVKKGIDKMREVEKDTVARIKSELGGEVRFESFKKFEKRFYQNYERAPASP